MKSKSLIISLFLILNSFLWAQNYSLSVKTNFTPQRAENWNLSIQLQSVGNAGHAFALSFPANTNFTPVKIDSDVKNFWLKNDPEFPDSNNVVHWEKVDSLLILRFAPNTTFNTNSLTVQLNITNSRPGRSRGQIKWLAVQQNGQPTTQLGQAEFQFQQGMTR
ncbi:MAG: hypothetical protein J7L94_09520 [Caldisericaceae bacterium]|nr:hypothetical protein [Caldisericaceae bacterium]